HVQPQPDGVGSVGGGLPKSRAPFGIPQVNVKVVDEDHLAAPLHVRMRRLLLPLRLPRAPGGCLLLGNADQNDLGVTTLFSRGAQQRFSDLLLVVAFGEIANGNTLGFGPAVDSGDIGFTDLAKGSR